MFIADFFADGEERDAIVRNGIEIADLDDRIDSKVDTYSKGMMRRLLIARAVMTRPKFAILDEVTSGLDVVNAFEIRDLIRDLAKQGVSVILSSHNMFEVELMCDRVAMINEGRLVLEGTPGELKERYGAGTIEEVFVKAVKG
jgi:ABC-2 type transport system ATP-binding protein